MTIVNEKSGIKIYNAIFPLWAVFFLTPLIVIPLVGNFIIDGSLIYLSLLFQGIKLEWSKFWPIVLRAWKIGFSSDILGVIVAFVSYESINRIIAFENILLCYLFGIFIAGVSIFWFNYNNLLEDGFEKKVSVRVALTLSILTAPWMILIPPIY